MLLCRFHCVTNDSKNMSLIYMIFNCGIHDMRPFLRVILMMLSLALVY